MAKFKVEFTLTEAVEAKSRNEAVAVIRQKYSSQKASVNEVNGQHLFGYCIYCDNPIFDDQNWEYGEDCQYHTKCLPKE